MTRPPLPDNWESLLADYTLGQLDPSDAERVRSLLEAYPELTPELDRLQATLSLMPYALPRQNPPPHLRRAILEAAEAGRGVPALTLPVRRSHRMGWKVGGAIAAVLLVALAIDNYRVRQQLQDAQRVKTLLEQSSTVVYSLQGTQQAPQSSGRVLLNSNQQSIVVLVDNLPPLPNDQVYCLWGITPAMEVLYLGQFQSASQNRVLAHLNLPTRASVATTEVRITQEHRDAPPQPQGPLVMQGKLF